MSKGVIMSDSRLLHNSEDIPFVSVIIPVYNTEEYLEEAMGSVVDQTLKNIEIICIDDGSTDNSSAILDRWAKSDERITVISQENKGLSAARNAGFDIARGEYVYYMDSDDILVLSALEELYRECKENDLEVICFNAEVMIDSDYRSHYIRNGAYPGLYRGIDLLFELFTQGEWFTPVWIQMYKREYLHEKSVSFMEGVIYEDGPYTFESIVRAQRTGYCSKTLYRKRIREGSITRLQVGVKNVVDYYLGYQKIISVCNELKDRLNDAEKKKLDKFTDDYIEFGIECCCKVDYEDICNCTPFVCNDDLFINKVVKPSLGPDRSISIGIIFHNQAQYVRQCLDSVINQTYKRIEVICVDDASEDETRGIIQEYIANHDYIRLISLENNMSENIARKKAVNDAASAHMLFVDGDDYLEDNACEILIDEIRRSPADILQFGVNIIKGNDTTENDVILSAEWCEPMTCELYGEEVFRNCFVENRYRHVIWNKMYDTALLKRAFEYVEDKVLHYGGDLYQFFIISHMAMSSRGIETKLYNYLIGVGISSIKKISLDQYRRICSIHDVIEGLYEYSKKIDNDQIRSVINRVRISAIGDCIIKAKERLDGGLGTGISILKESFPIEYIVAELSHLYRYSQKEIVLSIRNNECFTPKRRKIKTIAAYYYRLGIGGTESVMAALAKVWMDAGYRVVLLTDSETDNDEYMVPDGVLQCRLAAADQNNQNDYSLRAESILHAIKQYEIDIIVYHAWKSENLLWDMLMCKLCDVRFLIHCHNVFSHLLVTNRSIFGEVPYIYSIADGVVTLTGIDTTYWSSFTDSVFQVVNPTKYQSIDAIPVSSHSSKNVIWCQRFSYEKNPIDVIDVFKLVFEMDHEARLIILGKDEDNKTEAQMRDHIRELELQEVVTIQGYVHNVEDYYKKSDVCMITSDYEGFPLGLMESMGAGIPVVMYSLPYLTIVEKGKGIISVEGHNKDKMADEIIKLLKDPERRKQLGKEARDSISEILEYDYEGRWKEIITCIEDGNHVIHDVPLMWQTLFEHYSMGWVQNEEFHSRILKEKQKENDRLENVISKEITRRQELETEIDGVYKDLGRINESYLRLIEDQKQREVDLENQNHIINELNDQIDQIHQSKSFKIGRALTVIPRWIRHIVSGYPM